jgi:hypothetical protein
MTFDEHWARLVLANPGLDQVDSALTLPVPEFRRQLERAYKLGHIEGQLDGAQNSPLESLFTIFDTLKGNQA